MPTGFAGAAALTYLSEAESGLTSAAQSHGEDPFSGMASGAEPFPALPCTTNQDPPHPASTAGIGGNATGTGTSSNIVAGGDEYDGVLMQIRELDGGMGDALRKAATDIEQLCGGAFSLPLTSPKCGILATGIKNMLDEYASLTEEMIAAMRKFVNGALAVH